MASLIVDLVSLDKEYFSASKKPKIMLIDEKLYLSLKGKGSPEDVSYHTSIEALYSAAYQLKFNNKKKDRDFKVSKLECLWWTNNGRNFSDSPMNEWNWKLLIRIPDFVTIDQVEEVTAKLKEEKGMKEADLIQLDTLKEGKCVQVMHQGPYDAVGEAYEKLLEFMEDSGFQPNGPYHEIYISDPNRTDPERLKTVVRQPVR